MRQELIAELNAWHEQDEYQKIVDRIREIPDPLIDDELAVHLGRAYNNLGKYKTALKWFNKISEEGRNDALWHFRVGYANYYLDRNEEAIQAFEQALELDPEDEDARQFLEWSREAAANQPEKEEDEEDE